MRKMVEYGIWNHLVCQLMPLGPVCGGGGPQDAANLKYHLGFLTFWYIFITLIEGRSPKNNGKKS